MGKIEKLVVLSVLLVIVGILGAAQIWAPDDTVQSTGVDPAPEGLTLDVTGVAVRAEEEVATFPAPADAPEVNPEPETAAVLDLPMGDLITRLSLEPSQDSGLMLYTVQPGDTFESIAACYYGESSRAIVVRRENEGLETPVAGTRIWIAVEDDGTNAERMYTVVEGDNLWNIAHKAYGKGWWYKRIQVANQNMLGESNALRVGMKLRLP
jgi:nucleoid-associated protein YgaU